MAGTKQLKRPFSASLCAAATAAAGVLGQQGLDDAGCGHGTGHVTCCTGRMCLIVTDALDEQLACNMSWPKQSFSDAACRYFVGTLAAAMTSVDFVQEIRSRCTGCHHDAGVVRILVNRNTLQIVMGHNR